MTDTVQHNDDARKITGKHVACMFVGGFGVIIAVNIYMATQAVGTFPGLEVSSSYADSQTFDDRRVAQQALGWHASVETDLNELRLSLVDDAGRPVYPAQLDALLTRPTTRADDQALELTRGANGVLVAPAEIGDGRWRLRLTGTARDGTDYRHNITFTVDRD